MRLMQEISQLNYQVQKISIISLPLLTFYKIKIVHVNVNIVAGKRGTYRIEREEKLTVLFKVL